MDGRLTITEVAKYVGVTPRTIMRWEKGGKIKRSRRDWRGWRFYLKEDLEDIKKFYESTYEYNEGDGVVMDMAKGTLVSVILALALALPIYSYAQQANSVSEATSQKAISETRSTVDINLASLPAVQAPPASVAEAMKYTLGPDDVVEIEVRRHPEFSGQYPVNSEGKIEYKFVGDVIVAGLTKVQLQERLASILSEYIIEPDINVRITAYLSKVFYVVGEVNNPGKFYMKGNTITVREALVQAGLPAVGSSAMRKCRLVTPDSKGRSNYRYINAYALLFGGDLRQNIEMRPGDVLYVPSTIMAKLIRVISPVTNAVSSAAGSAAAGASMVAVGL
ncbi:MAG: polysaccharide biosynthesis/export family protein [Candidatus Omnitrophica bacterium]|nr:polysaccharide biosynthesis/export family protein [Candidatus Omnitrophota bacterium]MDD5436779.1 polysaccharide biosynthesis/export family protein [Candidatus Omnitrophota bacterium]